MEPVLKSMPRRGEPHRCRELVSLSPERHQCVTCKTIIQAKIKEIKSSGY